MPTGDQRFRFSMRFTIIIIVSLSMIISSPMIQISANGFGDDNHFIPQTDLREFNAEFTGNAHDIPLIIFPLYHKLNTSDILENGNRANIFSLISSNPGISFGTITRELRLSNGTVQHHLRILESHGYIQLKRNGRQTRYYLVGAKASELSETQDSILNSLKKNPGISQSEIARDLDISRQLVNYHMKILVDKGLVVIEKGAFKSSCFSVEDYRI